jgi:hypothetical protein
VDRNDPEPQSEKARADGKSFWPLAGGEANLFHNADTAILRVDAKTLAGAQPIGVTVLVDGRRFRFAAVERLDDRLDGGDSLSSRDPWRGSEDDSSLSEGDTLDLVRRHAELRTRAPPGAPPARFGRSRRALGA